MRMLYVIYATLVSVIVTSCNYGATSSPGSYRSWSSGSSSYGGGGFGGGHK